MSGGDTNLASSEENEVLSADEQTFTQLNATINAKNEKNIYLNGNYKYSSGDDSFKDGVVISREVNIYGNGAVIDGNNQARIFQINGGYVVFHNITFVNANAGDNYGGAIYGYCRAINCTFKENHAGYGGAMFGGSAVKCTFSGNTADVQGGAMVDGSAVNCTFSGNTAGVRGGAIEGSHAVNCTFSGNTAEYGGAISVGYKLNCIGQDPNDYYKTEDLVLHWDADNFTIAHGSVKKLPIGLRDQDDFSIDFINYDVVIYKDGSKFRTYHCLGYEELSVDLDVGVYTAELTVTYLGINQPEPKNITLTIVKTDGTTFSDLNSLINNNTNDTITLDKDYAFNSTVDSYFTEGVAINRPLAINGNGHTIDAKGKAGVFNVAAGDVTINNMTIKNGRYRDGGAIYFIRSGTVKNCNFTGNEGSFGGAICFDEAGNVENCNFDNNKATYDAGAVYFAGQGTVLNCTFTDNHVVQNGGAVYFAGQGTVLNCNFTGNEASEGGAIEFIGTVNVENCNFDNNKATYGGAVYFYSSASITDCNFINNNATTGGAIFFYSSGSVTNCNLTNNNASNDGGAVYFNNDGHVENCNFTDNEVTSGESSIGGALYFEDAGTVTDCTFSGNAANYGGAVYFNGTGNVSNCNFTNNTAGVSGGAIWFTNNGNVTNCNFVNDTAYEGGGAMYHGSAVKCTFSGNSAENGGAIFEGSARDCTFSGNSAEYGGAIFEGSARDCTFSGNAAESGGAMFGGSARDCTFSGNTADYEGGAIDSGSAVNCTFSGNTAEYGGAISFGYKLNCIGQDPNDYYETEDLALWWDADNFTTPYGSVKKLPIALRGQNGFFAEFINYDVVIYKDGSEVRTYHCLGYEELSIDLDVGIYAAELSVTYPGINQPEPKNITLTIVKTDGTTFSDLNDLINNNTNGTIALDKDYAFNSTVDSDLTSGIWISRPLTINGNGHTIDAKGKARVFYVDAGDVTINNMTIKNGHGDYGGAISFQSSGTVENCNFTGNEGGFGGAICFDEAGNVENCNFADNKVADDGGAVYFLRQGTVSNCNFADNKATYGGAVYFGGQGTVLNCNFADNKATYGGAVYFGGQGTVLNCNFTDNLADISGGAIYFYSWGNVTNCNFVNDTAYERGGAIMATNGGSVENCNFTDCHTSNEKDSSKAAIYDDGGNLVVDNCNYFDTPIATVIVSSPVTTVYNVNKNLVITLKDSQGRPLDGISVSVNINGNKVYTTDRNGQIKINVAKLVPKTYTAKITFNGNSKYEASSASVKVTVKKAKAKMVAKKKTFKRKVKVKKYTITLKNNVGKAIKNAKVTIKIKKKTYRAKTNAKGKATFKIKKLTKKGKFKAKITFKGNKYYKATSKKTKITIK